MINMVEFKDKNGQPLSLSTSLDNVNMELTSLNDLALAEWDRIKPNLGTMDQKIALPQFVDQEDMALSERFQAPAQDVPEQTWLEKWDEVKPNLGTMTLPYIVEDEEGVDMDDLSL